MVLQVQGSAGCGLWMVRTRHFPPTPISWGTFANSQRRIPKPTQKNSSNLWERIRYRRRPPREKESPRRDSQFFLFFLLAAWPSGKAGDCKSFIPSSNLGVAWPTKYFLFLIVLIELYKFLPCISKGKELGLSILDFSECLKVWCIVSKSKSFFQDSVFHARVESQ